jgi:hypothetical protein
MEPTTTEAIAERIARDLGISVADFRSADTATRRQFLATWLRAEG